MASENSELVTDIGTDLDDKKIEILDETQIRKQSKTSCEEPLNYPRNVQRPVLDMGLSSKSVSTLFSRESCGDFEHPLAKETCMSDHISKSKLHTHWKDEDSTPSLSSGQCWTEKHDLLQEAPLSMSDASKDNALQNDLTALGLKQEDIEFIFENGDKFLEKPALLAKKLKIDLGIAKSSIEAYKAYEQESASFAMSQNEINKIEECMRDNTEFDSAEDIAILVELDESLVAAYLESRPMNDTQKAAIKERFNAGYTINDIANILKLSINNVKEFVRNTFVTFDGKEGQIYLEIIRKNFPEINCSKLREMIITKNLKLQDQLCYILRERRHNEYLSLRHYIEGFEESKSFYTVDFNLTIEDIILINESSSQTVEELSVKLNKVESVIREFLHHYHPYQVVTQHSNDMQRKQLSSVIRNNFAKANITFHTYRMIISNSFKEIICRAEHNKQGPLAVLNELLPLAFYYLKCSLPLDEITQIIANTSQISITTHDVFHILFQLSDPVLRGYCIEHYSFSNPIPFYYPNLDGKLEICKELWYSLQEFNGLMSFGLGKAGWNPVGKSYLLDFIFGTDFVRGNPQKSAFHLNSIDIQMTKNLFVEKDKASTESTKWAYIDCHGHSKLGIIQAICKELDIAIVHATYLDYKANSKLLFEDLKYFRQNVKHVYCFIRDYEGVEMRIESTSVGNRYFLIPNLTKPDTNIHSIKKSLIEIGYEILHLKQKNPKYIGNGFLERIIAQLDPYSLTEIQDDKKILETITNHIRQKTQASHKIDFSFLSYYPLFIEYMSHYYRASYALDQKIVDDHNDQCAQYARQLNDAKMGEIVKYFNILLQKKNYMLILWKLSQDFFLLSKQMNVQTNPDIVGEQKNEKYTIEILWREAFLSYNFGDLIKSEGNYVQDFAKNFSSHVERGEPFEIIDGDNLRFFNKEINALLFDLYAKQNDKSLNLNEGEMKQAPIIVSIIGPQSSGKSTLLNYCFGCKFITSAGRCTRGIYGSLSRLTRPVNRSNHFLILDTEGLDAIERGFIKDTSYIHFDRTMVLFCLAVSQVVIINVKGDIGSEMHNLLQVCAYSMKKLKVTKVPAPKIFFVLNQQADPDPDKHLDSINILMNKLNQDFELLETDGTKISDLIQISKENLFILPSAFNSEQINKKLFDSNVNKLSPTITFADKCADLRLAIIRQLENVRKGEKLPFETMNEWMEMSGTIWDTIVRYQDIVKYRNVEEEICSNMLREIVSDLMQTNIYSYQQTFLGITEDLTYEIQQIERLSNPNTILTNFMIRFDEVFEQYQKRCLTKFENKCQSDSLLKKMNHICCEANSNLSRLIFMERKIYEDKLKFQIRAVLTEIKLAESMKKFQEMIVMNVDKYLSLQVDEQKIPFEETWCRCFDTEDKNEEEIERDETFNNLFSIFLMESKTMEIRTTVRGIFGSMDFNMDDIINSIELDILTRFQLVPKEKLEQFIFPCSENNTSLKHMTPYQGKSIFHYLSRDSLYNIEMEKRMLVFYKVKIKTFNWFPIDCRPLIKHCSGYYNHPDIVWKKLNKNEQILRLASKLRAPNCGKSSWEKLINDIRKEIRIFIELDPIISPGTVKLMVNFLCSLFKLVNYEISFIEAKLTNTAERTISILVFAYAFQSLWKAKRNKPLENKASVEAKKKELLQYFLQKIENRKMVRGTWDHRRMKESDHKLANKFAQDFIRAVGRGIIASQQPIVDKLFNGRKESMSHERIFFSANSLLIQELDKKPAEEVMCESHFVVQYICNRNELLMKIFLEKWDAIVEDELYHEIAKDMKIKVMKQIRTVINVLRQLLDAIQENASSSGSNEGNAFDSDSNFELADMESIKTCGTDFLLMAKESPFQSVNLFIKMYLDPTVSSGKFNNFFTNIFAIDGVKMKPSDTYVLCDKPLNPVYTLNTELFKRLENTKMFNSENIYNILEYLTVFIGVLDEYEYELSLLDFRELVYQIKEDFKKNALGCTSQCPSCGKLCERELHPNDGKCQIKTGHQICSMGGMVWNNDEKKTAVLFMCEDYKDDTRVCLPGQDMNWGKFKIQFGRDWDWNLPDDEKYRVLQQQNREKMRNIWNTFGKGILNYYSTRNIKISYVPYEDLHKSLELIEYYICFVIDGTSSMLTEINKARISVEQFIDKYKNLASQVHFKVVIYRDHCDDKTIEMFPRDNVFTPQYKSIQQFLESVKVYGGGDYPEAVLDGLATAANRCEWRVGWGVRNIIIHIFDAPPHGNFPDYESHDSKSNQKHCCCCNHGTICPFDWSRDVWDKFKMLKIQYHGINTGKHFPEFETTMHEKLGDLCGSFQSVGKEVVNDAILQIFINQQM